MTILFNFYLWHGKLHLICVMCHLDISCQEEEQCVHCAWSTVFFMDTFLSFNWRNLFEIITILSTIKIRWKMVIIFLQSWSTGAFPFHVFLEKAFFSRRNSVTRWIQHLFPWGGRAAMSCNWALPSWLRLLTIFSLKTPDRDVSLLYKMQGWA